MTRPMTVGGQNRKWPAWKRGMPALPSGAVIVSLPRQSQTCQRRILRRGGRAIEQVERRYCFDVLITSAYCNGRARVRGWIERSGALRTRCQPVIQVADD